MTMQQRQTFQEATSSSLLYDYVIMRTGGGSGTGSSSSGSATLQRVLHRGREQQTEQL